MSSDLYVRYLKNLLNIKQHLLLLTAEKYLELTGRVYPEHYVEYLT